MKHLLAVAALVLSATPLSAAEPIEGRWVTAEKDAIVQISDCGRSICGRIAKFLVTPPQGADQRDVNNRDAAKRSRTGNWQSTCVHRAVAYSHIMRYGCRGRLLCILHRHRQQLFDP